MEQKLQAHRKPGKTTTQQQFQVPWSYTRKQAYSQMKSRQEVQGLSTSTWQLMRALESSQDLRPLALIWTYDSILKEMVTYATVI